MKPYKILIVEDQMIVQVHLERIVREMGHEIAGVATNPDEAFAAAERNPPDLVLMDIHLADGTDGVDAATVLRSRYDCAVVFVTAYADTATVERTCVVGAAGYVVKPFTDVQVHAAIATAMAGHTYLRHLEHREHALASFVAGTREAVVLATADGSITFMNGRATELFGRSSAAASGENIVDLVVSDGAERLRESLRGTHAAPTSVPGLGVHADDGSIRAVRVGIERAFGHRDELGGLILTFRDEAD